MANLKFSNFSKAKLTTPPVGDTGLTFTVEAGFGALFPALGAGEYFYGVFKDASQNVEIVKVVARAVDLFTIDTGARGIDGTSARTWLANDLFVGSITAIAMTEFIPTNTTIRIGETTLEADKLPYMTGADSADTTDFTPLARTLLDDLTTAAMRSTLDAVSRTVPESIGGKKTFTDSVVQNEVSDITAVATVDLTAEAGNIGHIIGNTGITEVVIEDGKTFLARFASNPLLTWHVTNLNINNGATNYQVIAGDQILFYGIGGVTYGQIFPQLGTPAGLPVGSMIDYGGDTLPTGWFNCHGAAVDRTTYADLFAAIGVIWGVGDGSTTFNLPNMNRRVSVGEGGSGTGTLGNDFGDIGGSETHTLTTAQMPSHVHGNKSVASSGSGHNGPVANINGGLLSANAYDTLLAGSTTSHNNMQPSAVVKKIIKWQL